MEIETPNWFESDIFLDKIFYPLKDISVVFFKRISKNDLFKLLAIPLNREVKIYELSDEELQNSDEFCNLYLYDTQYNLYGCMKYIEFHKRNGDFPTPSKIAS